MTMRRKNTRRNAKRREGKGTADNRTGEKRKELEIMEKGTRGQGRGRSGQEEKSRQVSVVGGKRRA